MLFIIKIWLGNLQNLMYWFVFIYKTFSNTKCVSLGMLKLHVTHYFYNLKYYHSYFLGY